MRKVNLPQNFLAQKTETDFQYDIRVRKQVTSENLHYIPRISILQQETLTNALNMVTSDFVEAQGIFNLNQRREYVGGQQVATNTKKMVEKVCQLDLDSHQDDWFSPEFHEDRNDLELLLSQGYSEAGGYLSPKSRRKLNQGFSQSFFKVNQLYWQVDTETAMTELSRISFPYQDNEFKEVLKSFQRAYDSVILGKSNIETSEMLQNLIFDFHYFVVQYHHFSYQEQSEKQKEVFIEGLKYFAQEIGYFSQGN